MTVLAEFRRYIPQAVVVVLCCFSLLACNEAPTDLGAELITGTDTLYAFTSGEKPMLDSLHTVSSYPVMYNSAYVLFGKTATDEGRMFLEIIEYPDLGDTSRWSVVECALGMLPQPYIYGDTLDATLGMKGYELQKTWETQITWDSVWQADGSSSYYSTSSATIVDTTVTIAATDTLVYLNFNKDAVRRWLVVGADTARRSKELFGMVLLPTNNSSIRQYRNANQNVQVMLLRVVTKNVDKATPDTTYLKTAVASFVNTAPPQSSELVVQGARIHSTQLTARIDSLPPFAVVVGASFTVYVNKLLSVCGTGGLDETMELEYTDAAGSVLRFQTTLSDSSKYVFQNIAALAQRIQKDGGKGVLTIQPSSLYNTWRMNRIVLHDGSQDAALAPRLMVVFTVPTVFK